MLPQALLAFPGLDQVVAWSFTLSHGITPGVAHVEIAPQFGLPAEIGTMVISFGDVELSFADCVLDSANVRRDGSGMIVSLAILDRRWMWRFGQISGRYNVRGRDGQLDAATEQPPQDLAALLLTALGESGFDVAALPDQARPEVDWVYANPAQELAALAESLGCRVVLGLDGFVSLQPAGAGADLPDLPAQRTRNFGIDPPNLPDALLLAAGPTRFETRFRLEAVGLEKTGEIRAIDSLSYAPAGGWGNEAYFGFANVADPDCRALARQTVFRWYRIQCTAPFTSEGKFQIGGYDGPVDELWQVLPLEQGRIATYSDVDGIERSCPAEIAGIYWDRALDANNVPAQRRYRGRFSIDAGRGIVRFAEPVLQAAAATAFAEAKLFLTVAHPVKDANTLQDVRRTYERALPVEPNGTGPRVLRRDDLIYTVATQYDAGNNPLGTTDNGQALDAEANEFLDAAAAEFQTLATDQAEYAGIVPIDLDGAIHQVQWSGGPAGGLTRAGRNMEFSLVVPPWRERRQAETRRDQARLSVAAAAALKQLRDVQGAR